MSVPLGNGVLWLQQGLEEPPWVGTTLWLALSWGWGEACRHLGT